MSPLSHFLILVVPAAIVTGAVLVLGLLFRAKPSAREEPRPAPGLLGRLLPPLLFALAFWPADIGLHQWHGLWPKDGTLRFLAVALGAGSCGVLHAVVHRRLFTAIVRLALGAAIPLGVLTPLPEQFMPPTLLVALTVATSFWLAGMGGAIDAADRRLPRFAVPGGLALAAIVLAPGLFEIGYAGAAQLAAALASMAGGLAIASLLRPRIWADFAGAHTVWLALLGTILLATYGYAKVLAWWALLLMALAPLGALAPVLLKRAWLRTVAAILAPAVIGGAATAAVVLSAPEESDESYYGY